MYMYILQCTPLLIQFVSSTSSELRVADRLSSGRGITANIRFNYLTFP